MEEISWLIKRELERKAKRRNGLSEMGQTTHNPILRNLSGTLNEGGQLTNQPFLHLLSFIQKKNNFSFSFQQIKQRNSIDLFGELELKSIITVWIIQINN